MSASAVETGQGCGDPKDRSVLRSVDLPADPDRPDDLHLGADILPDMGSARHPSLDRRGDLHRRRSATEIPQTVHPAPPAREHGRWPQLTGAVLLSSAYT